MKRFLSIYHKLPSPFWPIIASLKAFNLRKRRYGKIFHQALPRITERLHWSFEQWRDFQRKQLAEILHDASVAIPAYIGNPDPSLFPNDDPVEVLKKWPLINLTEFKKEPNQYMNQRNKNKLITLFTSGTSGTPKKIVRDIRAEQLNYAYMESRWRNTAGVKLGDRWVMIGGQLVVPVERRKPPFCVPAYPMLQLYASSYHLHFEFAEYYMKQIQKWNPTYMLGYASSLNMLGKFSELTGIKLNLKCIISNAEPLYDHIREKLENIFNCKVYDTYGATEGAFMAFECCEGNMHVSPDFGVFEILRDDGTECQPGEIGKVVVTGLTNRTMPLIRYPNGDTAAWSDLKDCNCGCSFPIIERIEGRIDDMIELPNGRFVGRLDPVFKAEFPILEAQIVQKKDKSIEVFIVKDEARTSNESEINNYEILLMRELRARLGNDVSINITYVEKIQRGTNHKFKAVVRES